MIIKPKNSQTPTTKLGVDPVSPNGLPPIITATELFEMSPTLPRAVIHDVLCAGSVMVYGGGSKTNKTFALMDLAVSVAMGSPWMDFKTEKGKVLYIDLEIQLPHFRSRLFDISLKKDGQMDSADLLNVWPLRGKAQDISTLLPELELKLSGKNYSLIIIDPIYKLLGKRDENSAGDINSLMNDLDRLASVTGAAIVVGHHFSKGGQAGKESMDRISGSGVFARSPDTIMIITKHESEGVFVVDTTLRNFKPIKSFCVRWEWPLMVRSDSYDPTKLKNSGAKTQQYTGEQLLNILNDQELTTDDWRIKCVATHKMSDRTFAVKKKGLEDAKKISKTSDGKWKAASKVDVTTTTTTTNHDQGVQQQQNHPVAA